MFAGEPPSSSEPTKRLPLEDQRLHAAFRRLLLQIGGANSASADRALKAAVFLTLARGQHDCEVLALPQADRSLIRPDSGARHPV
jgi:hypothetical protein